MKAFSSASRLLRLPRRRRQPSCQPRAGGPTRPSVAHLEGTGALLGSRLRDTNPSDGDTRSRWLPFKPPLLDSKSSPRPFIVPSCNPDGELKSEAAMKPGGAAQRALRDCTSLARIWLKSLTGFVLPGEKSVDAKAQNRGPIGTRGQGWQRCEGGVGMVPRHWRQMH